MLNLIYLNLRPCLLIAVIYCLGMAAGSSVNQKIICTCLLDGLHDSEMLTCANSHKLVISDAYLFDYGTLADQDNCTLSQLPDKYTDIAKDLRSICSSGSSCLIRQSDLINIKDDHTRMDCLAILVIWNCLRIFKDAPTSDFKFTYIFYMITLICSSLCILAGSLLILRKYIITRRRNNQRRSHRSSNQQSSVSQNFFNSIWTTSPFDPPAYENAYNSSLPITHSLPPSYDETNIKKDFSSQVNQNFVPDEPDFGNNNIERENAAQNPAQTVVSNAPFKLDSNLNENSS